MLRKQPMNRKYVKNPTVWIGSMCKKPNRMDMKYAYKNTKVDPKSG